MSYSAAELFEDKFLPKQWQEQQKDRLVGRFADVTIVVKDRMKFKDHKQVLEDRFPEMKIALRYAWSLECPTVPPR
ncbi:unnamed protein product [Dibothriocephalus latus]|uniref:Uncharacterized protein n=1 Tax=Dibothriocephalus latus TaxID=60516 RepID=A0A3P7R9G4_DIBLA|nr:unnamed protein product [Dibothriocephalus latus]